MLARLLAFLKLPIRPLINWFIVPKLVWRKSPLDGHPIFLVVHGTWGRKSKWTQKGEPLDKMVCELDEYAGIAVFTWSGSKHLTARTKAAAALSDQLVQLRRQHSNSRITTIAHSHGGNVVAWAASTTDALDRSVYVNTPFMASFTPTPFRRTVAVIATMYIVFLLLWAETGLVRIGYWHWNLLFVVIISGSSALAVLYLTTLAERRERRFAGLRQTPRELVVHAAGDEALSGLTALYAVHGLVTAISRPLFVVLILGMLVCTTLLNTNWFGLALWGEDMYDVPLTWLFRIARLYGGVVLIAVLAYGPLQGLMSFQRPLLVTPTPLRRVDALTVQVTRKRGAGWLLHSIPLADEKVLHEIANWLEPSRRSQPPVSLL